MSEIQQLAKGGHAAAQFVLYERWLRERKEDSKAMFESAAAAGLPQAMYSKGCSLVWNHNIPDSERLEGWSLVVRAAYAGYPYAKMKVAEFEGGFASPGKTRPGGLVLVKPNFARALEFYRDCLPTEEVDCLRRLALLYSSGIGEPRDESESPHNLLLKAARLGDAEAMYLLAERYLVGHGEKVDILEAARWQCMAHQTKPNSGFDHLYVDGQLNPIAQDTVWRAEFVQAFSLYLKVNERHDPAAALELARLLRRAGKTPESMAFLKKAVEWRNREAVMELKELEHENRSVQKSADHAQ